MITQTAYENSDGYDSFDVECDNCGEKLDLSMSWSEIITYIKNEGWRIKKVDKYWEHYCNVCK